VPIGISGLGAARYVCDKSGCPGKRRRLRPRQPLPPSLFSRGNLGHAVKIVLPKLAFTHQEFAAQIV